MSDEIPTEKPKGWKTSEFWQSLMVTATGCFCIIYGVTKDNEGVMQIGSAIALGSTVTYTAARSFLKR